MKSILYFLFSLILFSSCDKNNSATAEDKAARIDSLVQPNNPLEFENPQPLSKNFKSYWYASEAEISSYELEQYRYGELRKGEAVLIYVTEPFLKQKQVKANSKSNKSIDVLKLNTTKNFVTGIYPYSIMQSVFFPVGNNSYALKATASIQEWCGQTYKQLNNKTDFEIISHSYFEGEADQNFTIEKAVLENELWTQLRINPKSLPTGIFNCVPSLEFLSLNHIKTKAFKAEGSFKDNTYTLNYLDLNRTLKLTFENSFPYKITSWEDTYKGQTSKGTLKTSLKSSYWSKNKNEDVFLREILQLKN